MRKYKGEIGLFIVAIIWGSGFVGTRLALDGGLTALQVVTLRFLVASLLISIVFFKNIKQNINKEAIKAGIILGFFLFTSFLLQTKGLVYTTPSKNAFLTAVNVVIVPFIGFAVYKRKLDKIGIMSSIMTLVGIAVLSLQADLKVNLGDALTLGGAFLFAFHIFFTSEFVNKHDAFVLTSVQFITTFILAFISQFVFGEGSYQNVTMSGYMGSIYLGLFSTGICFLMQTICQSIVDETRSAIILSTEAVFGTIFSVIILSEIITARMVIGSVIIFTSIIIAETKPNIFKSRKDEKEIEASN